MARFVRGGLVGAFAASLGGFASAQSLTTDKRDYRHDEPIVVRYTVPSQARTAGVTAHVDEGPCLVPFWSSTTKTGEGTYRLLAGQGPVGSECHFTIRLVADGRVVASKPVRVLRALVPVPGLIAGAPTRHPVSNPLSFALRGLGSVDPVHARSLRFKLLRLGRALPGGAVVRENVLVDRLLASGDESIEIPVRLLSRIGPHEARVVGADDAVLDRRQIDVVAPEAERVIDLDPDPGDRPFSADAPPRLTLALPGYAQSREANLGLSLWRIDRGDTPVEWHRLGIGATTSNEHDRRMLREFLRHDPVPLAPGTYDIVVSNSGIVIDRRRVQVAGRPGPAAPAFSPAVEFGVPSIVLAPDARVASGASVDVSVAGLPAGVPAPHQKLYLMLVRPEHYTWYCSLAQNESMRGPPGAYAWAELDRAGRGRFVAPMTTGPWELRLYRGGGVVNDLWGRQGQLLAKRRFEVIAPLVTGPVLVSEGARAIVEPIEVVGVRAGPPPPARPLDLVRTARVLEGGAVSETRRESRSADRGGAKLGVVTVSGRYEIRQLAAAYHLDSREEASREWMYVGRTVFDVASTAFPRLQRNPAPAALEDWPSPDDPVRGVRQWLKPDAECREPSFAHAPVLRFVKLVHDTNTGDRRFVPVDGVFPGHPYFVEAQFATAPPDERYHVRIGADERVEVGRTDDPRRYRSGPVNVVPGGGR